MNYIRPVLALGVVGGLGIAAAAVSAQTLNTLTGQPASQFFFTGAPSPFSRSSGNTPGRQQEARFSSSLEWNDNYDLREDSAGNALIWDNILGYGIERRTLTDEFILDAQGTIRASDLPSASTELDADDAQVRLSYGRIIDDNAIRFDLRYQHVDVAFFDPLRDLDIDGSFDDPSTSDGTRQSLRANLGVTLNADGPVSFDFLGAASRIDYYDTTDPGLTDRNRGSFRADVGFALSPIMRLTTGGFYDRNIEDENDLDRQTRRVDVGFDGLINPRLRAIARVGYSEVETERNGVTDTQSGTVGDLSFTATEKNGGETRFGLSTRLDENGQRSDATVGKTLVWDNGQLDGDIGVSVSKDTELRPIGRLVYVYTLPRSRLSANFRQVTTVDDDGEDVINTALDLGYTQLINRVSSFDIGIGGGLQRFENSDSDPSERINFTAQYNHALTRDWTLNTGYRHRWRDSDEDDLAQSNAVFLGLSRTFASQR